MTNEGFQQVRRRGKCRTPIKCEAKGGRCKGTCPAFRVVLGETSPAGLAECRLCSATFSVKVAKKAVKEYEAMRGSSAGGGAKAGSRLAEATRKSEPGKAETQKLQEQIDTLKAQLAAKGDPVDSATLPANNLALSDGDKNAVKALQKQVQQLKELDPALRESLCESKGGYEAFVANLEQQRQDIFARHRGALPIDVQKSKSELHLKNMQRLKSEADAKLEDLQSQKAEVEKKVAAQVLHVAEAEAKLQAAKLEAASIAQAAAAQTCIADGIAVPVAQGQASIITAKAVKGFFQSLPPTVAGHPEGIDTIAQVMALLEKLDSAAKHASAPAAPPVQKTSTESDPDGMDYDDELLNELAVAAVGPLVEEGHEAGECHRRQIAEAKGRISKVKKVAAKK